MKCLLTTLKESCEDASLPKLGEIRMHITPIATPTRSVQWIGLAFSGPTELRIEGDGYFTDANLTANLGKVKRWSYGDNVTYLSNGDYYLVFNKYTLTSASFKDDFNMTKHLNKTVSIKEFEYATGLTWFNSGGLNDGTNEFNPKRLRNLTHLRLDQTDNRVNLENLPDAPLRQLLLRNAYGPLSAIKYTNLTELRIYGDVTGDLSHLPSSSTLTMLDIYEGDLITGNLSTIAEKFPNIKDINISKRITGDPAKLPASARFLMGDFQNVTWSNRPTSSTIVTVNCVSMSTTDLDAMLNNQAQCKVPDGFASLDYNHHLIRVTGTRTSASDAAVATLKSKGYQIMISGALQ